MYGRSEDVLPSWRRLVGFLDDLTHIKLHLHPHTIQQSTPPGMIRPPLEEFYHIHMSHMISNNTIAYYIHSIRPNCKYYTKYLLTLIWLYSTFGVFANVLGQ